MFGATFKSAASAYSPITLFNQSQPGFWYDPSDMTTLFQDTAGTTPVTAAGQSVGLALDKSRGLVLGPEVVAPLNFTSGWSSSGAAVTFDSASTFTAAGTANIFRAYFTVGLWYKMTFKATFTGSIVLYNSNTAVNQIGPTSVVSGTEYTFYFSALATQLNIRAASTGSVTVTNISVKELPGNHATQSNSLSRPTLGRNPVGGTRNLLTYTEDFGNAAWAKVAQGSATAPTVTANAGTAPDGTTTAERVQFARTGTTTSDRSRLEQVSIPVVASTNYTFSVWMKSFSGADQTVRILPNYGNGNAVAATVTSEWQRFTVTANTLAGVTAAVVVGLGYVGNSVTAADVLIWGAQLELGSTATAYQKVVSAFDVTEAGKTDCWYLGFDGSDDFLVTPTITPGTDKAQVFTGVRKLSDAASGMLVESSAFSGSNDGAFGVFAPSSSAPNYLFQSRGTLLRTVNPSGFAAPITNVLTGLGDISAPLATIRANGVQVATRSDGQGTGNYLAYPAYIGRRGGTTFPFNGRIYGLICRFGANLTADQIVQTENWVANKTGIYTIQQLNQINTLNSSGASYNAFAATDSNSNNYLVPKIALDSNGNSYLI